MIRLAANTASTSSSSSSAYDSSSSVETPSPVKIKTKDSEESAAVAPLPVEDSGLPIWEDYLPDMQKQVDEFLTKALGNYVANSQIRPPPQAVGRALSATAISSSDSESEAPPAASVRPVKTSKKGKENISPPPTPVKSKPSKKRGASSSALPKNKRQLVQLAKKLAQALEKNY